MKDEGNVYVCLLNKLDLPSPRLIAFEQRQDDNMLILEDVGLYNLEQKKEARYYIKASEQLAYMRECAADNLAKLSPDILARYTLPSTHFIDSLHDILVTLQLPEQQAILHTLANHFPSHLNYLYEHFPLTIVHHDFMAKNLMISNKGEVIPIDWSITYISPHLGDLYNLIHEAKLYANVDKKDIIAAYLSVSNETYDILDWKLCIGGLCWLIKTLRWLTYGGTDIIPGSSEWIADLFLKLSHLTSELVSYNINKS